MTPSLVWTELKLAWELHQCRPQALAAEARQKLAKTAARQQAIEHLILQSPEAAQTSVAAAAIAERRASIRAQLEVDGDADAVLTALGLHDAEALDRTISRDLRIEGTLERIAASAPRVTVTEAEIYYRLNPGRFTLPERRVLRHILLTFSDLKSHAAASHTLRQIARTATSEQAFAEAALRHSECPTALQGGLLGTIHPGVLFPEVEAAAFTLQAGSLSPIVESEVGLHLLRCDAIEAPTTLAFAGVRDKLVAHLQNGREESARRTWIRQLAAQAPQTRHAA